MDNVGTLQGVTGRFDPAVEQALLAAPARALETARTLATSHFPESLVPDVLIAVGLEPEAVLGGPAPADQRRRSSAWRLAVIEAWDRQCAFCGFDGQLAGASVGLEAAHVRWFSYGGPDDLDNGLALCSLHHKLFDRGVLGLTEALEVRVSSACTARTEAGKAVYGLKDRRSRPRPGTPVPAVHHVQWHRLEVFKGVALAA